MLFSFSHSEAFSGTRAAQDMAGIDGRAAFPSLHFIQCHHLVKNTVQVGRAALSAAGSHSAIFSPILHAERRCRIATTSVGFCTVVSPPYSGRELAISATGLRVAEAIQKQLRQHTARFTSASANAFTPRQRSAALYFITLLSKCRRDISYSA